MAILTVENWALVTSELIIDLTEATQTIF